MLWSYAAAADDVLSDVVVHPSGDLTIALLRHPPERRAYDLIRLDPDGSVRRVTTLDEPTTIPSSDRWATDPTPLVVETHVRDELAKARVEGGLVDPYYHELRRQLGRTLLDAPDFTDAKEARNLPKTWAASWKASAGCPRRGHGHPSPTASLRVGLHRADLLHAVDQGARPGRDWAYLAVASLAGLTTGTFDEVSGEAYLVDLRNPHYECAVKLLRVYDNASPE